MAREKDSDCLLDERRRLLEYVLEVHRAKGSRVQLPIGMNTAEPWLLDAVDVQAILSCLHHANGAANIDLLQYIRKGSRTVTAEAATRTRSSNRDVSLDGEAAEREAPTLNIAQLQTGLSESEIKDLAYLVFVCNCAKGIDDDLLHTVRSQLDVDESRAAEVSRLLNIVGSTLAKMKETTGQLPVSDKWTANLELPVCLLGTVLPRDFNRFRSFVVWRDTLSHVLLTTLAQSVRDGWSPSAQQTESNPITAQQLMARLKAALRRCDVRNADDFDEAEYQDASKAVGQHTFALVKRTTAGWKFPWGLRVRLCEMLLRGVFDTLDEASYIDTADDYLRLLQEKLWPLLGISPSLHNACFAWIHFRQYVLTRHPGLLSKTKTLLKRLAQMSRQDSRNAAGGVTTPKAAAVSEDGALTSEVGAAVIDWITERLSDYHVRLSTVGGPNSLPGLVDVMAFAAVSKGATEDEVGNMLVAAIRSSVEKELHRRLTAEGDAADDEADNIITVCHVVKELAAEQTDTWARGFSGQLLESAPFALAVLHGAVGARILPWLGTISTLDDQTCRALQAALELEPQLLGAVTSAVAGCKHPATQRTLASAKCWDLPTQLQPVLAAWVDKQISGFGVWVDRQLQQETWEPLGMQQPHSASARELRRIVMESLEALFDLGLPLPAAIVSMHMEGIDTMMHRYLQGILGKLGSYSDMMPGVPPLTRFKREVAVKQEEAECHMPGLPQHLPPVGAVSKKGLQFLESVRRIEQEPCYNRIDHLSCQVIVVMMASLGYLLDTLQPIANAVADKWSEECRRSSHGSTGNGSNSNPFNNSSSGGGGSNPFRTTTRSTSDDRWGSAGGVGDSDHQGLAADASQQWGAGWGLGQGQYPRQGSRQGNGGLQQLQQQQYSRQQGEEMFSSMLEAAAQSLRAGVAAVVKWLAVRVVWWDQRAAWCELLYRHRVTSCRIDWLLESLGEVLGGAAGLLPQGPRLDLAAAVLKEVAAALERVLLDGGPCRWFMPADVLHLEDDLTSLKQLFHAEGDGLSMQDINSTLGGVQQLLQLMMKPAGTLIEAHRAARLDSFKGDATAVVINGGSSSPLASSAGSNLARLTPTSQQQQQQQAGPLSARMKTAAAGSAAGGVTGGSTPTYYMQHTGSSAGGSPVAAAGISSRFGQQCVSVSALVAAGRDISTNEQVLLKVLCHRAEHAASKYLKETLGVKKAKDDSLSAAFIRFKNKF